VVDEYYATFGDFNKYPDYIEHEKYRLLLDILLLRDKDYEMFYSRTNNFGSISPKDDRYRGNYAVYNFMRWLMLEKDELPIDDNLVDKLLKPIDMVSHREGQTEIFSKLFEDSKRSLILLKKMLTIRELLTNYFRRITFDMNKDQSSVYEVLNKHKSDSYNEKLLILMDSFEAKSKPKHIKMSSGRSIKLLCVNNIWLIINERDDESFFFTDVHYNRIFEQIDNVIKVLITTRLDIGFNYTEQVSLLKLFFKTGSIFCDFTGEIYKGLRNISVGKRLEDNLLKEPLEIGLISEYTDRRKEGIMYVMDKTDIMDSGQLTHMGYFYKFVPHPDIDLTESWEKLAGLKTPNRVDGKTADLVEGFMRKSIYESLIKQNYIIQVHEDENDPMFTEVLNGTSVKLNDVMKFSPLRWVGRKFYRTTLPNPSELKIDIQSKSSAPNIDKVIKELKLIREKKLTLANSSTHQLSSMFDRETLRDIRQKLRPVNDIKSYLTGEDELEFESAIKRFNRVKEKHEGFEQGRCPEDIRDTELEDFLFNNPDAAYHVMTEPKLGEKHKRTTRMFYMAEQQLKVLTQTFERYARLVSQNQNGVSITKREVSRVRDKDLFIRMCYDNNRPQNNKKTIFTSFDMSNFSMKFPMELIRRYGNIISELTGIEEFKRTDLFFRGSIVSHNSRNFLSYHAGISGGFEGFDNFAWSSIHASVMEYALYMAKKTGVLLTYSDDGLLAYNAESEEDKVIDDVHSISLKIQEEYKKCGLDFNLGKTFVSSKGWEYLGEVCILGSMEKQFFKQLSSINTYEYDTTDIASYLHNRISNVYSQCAAYVKNGGNPLSAVCLASLYAMLNLHDRFPYGNTDLLSVVLFLPETSGGVRCPNMFELSTINTVDKNSLFQQELIALNELFPKTAMTIFNVIEDYPPQTGSELSIILSRNIFYTSFPRLKPLDKLQKILDRIEAKSVNGRVRNVMAYTKEQEAKIIDLIKANENIDMRYVSEILHMTPEWKKAEDSFKYATSRGAMKILDDDFIRRIKREIHKSESKWYSRLVKIRNRVDGMRFDVKSLSKICLDRNDIIKKLYTGFKSILPFVNTHSISTTPPKIPDETITVIISPEISKHYSDKEELTVFSENRSQIRLTTWEDEALKHTDNGDIVKIQRLCSMMCYSEVFTVDFVTELLSILSIDFIGYNNITQGSIHKYRSVFKGSPDYLSYMPLKLYNTTKVFLGKSHIEYFHVLDSADRLTGIEMLKFYLLIALFYDQFSTIRKFYKANILYITILPEYLYQLTPHMKNNRETNYHGRELLKYTLGKKDEIKILSEIESDLKTAAKINLLSDVGKSIPDNDALSDEMVDDIDLVHEIVINDCVRFIREFLRPSPERIVETTAVFSYPPLLVNVLIDKIMGRIWVPLYKEKYGKFFPPQSDRLIEDFIRKSDLDEESLHVIVPYIEEFYDELRELVDDYYIWPLSLLSRMGISYYDAYKETLLFYSSTGKIESLLSKHSLVLDNNANKPGVSKSKVNYIRCVMNDILSLSYEELKDIDYDYTRFKPIFPKPRFMTSDSYLNVLESVRNSLRSSTHRRSPYNSKTVVIHLFRIYCKAYEVIKIIFFGDLDGSVKIKERSFDPRIIDSILADKRPYYVGDISTIGLFTRSSTSNEGKDHQAISLSDLEKWEIARVKYTVISMMDSLRYNGFFDSALINTINNGNKLDIINYLDNKRLLQLCKNDQSVIFTTMISPILSKMKVVSKPVVMHAVSKIVNENDNMLRFVRTKFRRPENFVMTQVNDYDLSISLKNALAVFISNTRQMYMLPSLKYVGDGEVSNILNRNGVDFGISKETVKCLDKDSKISSTPRGMFAVSIMKTTDLIDAIYGQSLLERLLGSLTTCVSRGKNEYYIFCLYRADDKTEKFDIPLWKVPYSIVDISGNEVKEDVIDRDSFFDEQSLRWVQNSEQYISEYIAYAINDTDFCPMSPMSVKDDVDKMVERKLSTKQQPAISMLARIINTKGSITTSNKFIALAKELLASKNEKMYYFATCSVIANLYHDEHKTLFDEVDMVGYVSACVEELSRERGTKAAIKLFISEACSLCTAIRSTPIQADASIFHEVKSMIKGVVKHNFYLRGCDKFSVVGGLDMDKISAKVKASLDDIKENIRDGEYSPAWFLQSYRLAGTGDNLVAYESYSEDKDNEDKLQTVDGAEITYEEMIDEEIITVEEIYERRTNNMKWGDYDDEKH